MLGRAAKAARTVATAGVDDSASFSVHSEVAWGPATVASGLARFARAIPWALCVITAAAAALRLTGLDDVSPNPFYDAAVRSMSLSWHNLFFGAFDPGGILSIDKPPLDLWLQVLSVKLLGWSSAALKLPEAIAGTVAVPLLYDAVRRAAGGPAGLGAALALAVLPESVLSSRSDTMDSLMMLLVIAALWLIIRAAKSGNRRGVILAGAVLGLAFNVKLFEALAAAPALAVLYALAAGIPWRRRLVNLALWALALVGVGLSWAVAVSLAPGRHPFPIGSSDGTVWNVIFVFNGFGRVAETSASSRPGGPGILRLFEGSFWHYDLLFGVVLIAALAIGAAALLRALARRRAAAPDAGDPVARAFAVALIVWIFSVGALFSHIAHLHPRYLEALAPAAAAAIGYGAAALAGLTGARGRPGAVGIVGIALALAVVCLYTLHFPPRSLAVADVALSVAAVGAAAAAGFGGRIGSASKWLTASLVLAVAVVFPLHESLAIVRANATDSMGLPTVSTATELALSDYLGPRTAGIRYELAVDEPLALATLIIRDQRPILPLTSFHGRVTVTLPKLQAAVQAGDVRYALVSDHRCASASDPNPACAPASRWIRSTGIDVSTAAEMSRGRRLYLLLPF